MKRKVLNSCIILALANATMLLNGCDNSIQTALTQLNNQQNTNTETETNNQDPNPSTKVDYDLEDLSIRKSSSYVGETVTISIQDRESLVNAPKNLSWKFVELPKNATMPTIMTQNNGYDISFVANKEGQYKIALSDGVNERIEKISVFYEVPYDVNKIQKVSEKSFYVLNQFLFFTSLTEDELATVLLKYPNLKLKYYKFVEDKPAIIYIEVVDEELAETQEQLSAFALESQIDFVNQRFENKDLNAVFFQPNDIKLNSKEYWHLDFMQATKIWDITRGSKQVRIGVMDGQIDLNHEDLKGRNITVYSNNKEDKIYHGSMVTGIIAANANNKVGIAGINYLSPVDYFDAYDNGNYTKSCSDNDNKVLNASFGPTPVMNGVYVDKELDPTGKIGLKSVIMKGDQNKKSYHKRLNLLIPLLTFDESNINTSKSKFLKKMEEKAIDQSRDKYFASYTNNNCLMVFSAGNTGIDAKYSNGSIHLRKDFQNNISRSSLTSNVIVVGAHLNNKIGNKIEVASYSSYGDTVDIYAPTEIKAPTQKIAWSSEYTNFDGTSAAAPMVTGIASLIYSINPNFSPAEVKEILLETADEMQGFRTPEQGEGANPVRELGTIKVMNAYKAVEEAKARTEATKVRVETTSEYVTNNLKLKPVSAKHTIKSFNGTITAGTPSCPSSSHYTQAFNNNSATDVTIRLNERVGCYTIKGKVKILRGNQQVDVDFGQELYLKPVTLTVKDQKTLQPLANARVKIENVDDLKKCRDTSCEIMTNNKGQISVLLPFNNSLTKILPNIQIDPIITNPLNPYNPLKTFNSRYKVFANLAGYTEGVMVINTDNNHKSAELDFMISKDDGSKVGAIWGQVVDTEGRAIENASVRISGGIQTNGYFASAQTTGGGVYSISNIVKNDSKGVKIPFFTVTVSAPGYKLLTEEKVVVLNGKTLNKNFVMQKGVNNHLITPVSGFEANEIWWKTTGFWKNISITPNSIYNLMFDKGFVSLPANETNSGKAYLPAPHTGKNMLWFGNLDTGSYIGSQATNNPTLAGGISNQAYSGIATSPAINLSGKLNPTLKFWTWWEIEGVNPNEKGFDLMEVQISNDPNAKDNTFKTIKLLNPKVDPNDSNRDPKPMTSGGYNRKPIWVEESIDLSSYVGQKVYVRFKFDTKDTSYNGFRGWFIDDVVIEDIH